jgi:hypothetical protein
MSDHDEENLQLLRATAGGLPYKPATYTCITEFTDSFPQKKTSTFVQQHFPAAETAWQPENPYPKIYTKHYRKSILSTLR